MKKILLHTGAVLEDEFIVQPGVMILKKPDLTPKAIDLFTDLGVSSSDKFIASTEFNAKLTYLAFGPRSGSGPDYVGKILDLGHYSVCGDWHVSLLIAGISDEIMKELIAHHEAHINRLTSSNTKAQLKTFHVLHPDPDRKGSQKKFIRDYLEFRDHHPSAFSDAFNDLYSCTELWNSFDLSCKAAYCTMTMSLKDYHKFLIGRMPIPGNESGIRQLATLICELLHKEYPMVIKDVAFYRGASNIDKLGLHRPYIGPTVE